MTEAERRAEAARMLATARACLDYMLDIVDARLAELRSARSPAELRSGVAPFNRACEWAEQRVHELAALDLAFRELGLFNEHDLTEDPELHSEEA